MMWFGASWGAPVCDPALHVATPVSMCCLYCRQPIEPTDQGVLMMTVTACVRPGDKAVCEMRPEHLGCFLGELTGPGVLAR